MNETKPLHLKIDQSSIDQSSRSQSVGHVKTVLKNFFLPEEKKDVLIVLRKELKAIFISMYY